MFDAIEPFGLTLLLVAVVASLALLPNRIGARLRIPALAIFLLGAAAASDLWCARDDADHGVEQVVAGGGGGPTDAPLSVEQRLQRLAGLASPATASQPGIVFR